MKKILKFFKYIFYSFICFLTPVQKNKIVFCAYGGKSGYCCNPKYITNQLLKDNLSLEIVWLVKNQYLKNKIDGVRFLDYDNEFLRIKTLASAKVWVDNTNKTSDFSLGLHKKKEQFYINTWHGSFGIKKMYWDIDGYKPKKIFSYFLKKDLKSCDCLLSNCKTEKQMFERAFKNLPKIKITGHPRNDIFFDKDNLKVKNCVFDKFNIPKDKKIALYAPTFRDFNDDFLNAIDVNSLLNTLKVKFNSDYIFLFRVHPKIKHLKNKFEQNNNCIDVSEYEDMQELLIASDCLISDYSSSMFDYLFLKRPCFVYAPDIDEYFIERGLQFSFRQTPFLVANDNEKLAENISKFDLECYKKNSEKFLEKMNSSEDGCAAKRVSNLILKHLD